LLFAKVNLYNLDFFVKRFWGKFWGSESERRFRYKRSNSRKRAVSSLIIGHAVRGGSEILSLTFHQNEAIMKLRQAAGRFGRLLLGLLAIGVPPKPF